MHEAQPSHSAVSEIQARNVLPVVTTVSARAYAAHGQPRHQTSCPVVEVPSNASLRDLISLSSIALPELEVDTQSTLQTCRLDTSRGYHGEMLEGTLA